MKKLLIVLLLAIPTTLFASSVTLEHMIVNDTDYETGDVEKVRQYAKEHKVSCSYKSGGCTVAGCGGDYINEDGNYVQPTPCNTCYAWWVCSDGKTFDASYSTY